MAIIFSKQRFGFANETVIEQLKNCSKNPNMIKCTWLWLNVPREKYHQLNWGTLASQTKQITQTVNQGLL